MENNTTDTGYVHRILNGETSAFKYLVESHQAMVFTIAFKILGNREEAEDVAQEVFIKCFKALERFNHKSKFATWLYRIAYNHSIDTLKKKKKSRNVSGFDDTNFKESNFEDAPACRMDNKLIENAVNDAIANLPEEDRMITFLYYYDEQPLKEIAEIIGIKENHVKIKLHRIRLKLSRQLEAKKEIINNIIY